MAGMGEGSAGGNRPLGEETAQLREMVRSFGARTDREVASRTRFLAELERLTEPCSRDADPVHVTASALVVGPRGLLLHVHKRAGRWMQPGGHIEPGEAPAEAARREAHEETGVAVRHPETGPRLVHLDVHPAGSHVHLDLRYLLFAEDAEPSPPPGESPEVRWFSPGEAAAVADAALVDALARLVGEWAGGARHGPGGGESAGAGGGPGEAP